MNKLQTVQNRAIKSIYRLDWCSPVDLIHDLSGLSLVEDRLTYLGKKYISLAEGRSELIELLISEYNAAKPTIQKNNKITPLCLFLGDSQDQLFKNHSLSFLYILFFLKLHSLFSNLENLIVINLLYYIFIMKNFKTIDNLIVYLLQRFGKPTSY